MLMPPEIKTPTLAWHVFWLVMSFNLMSVCTHTIFCWVYKSCDSYPASVNVVMYIMRMGDFSYGLMCGIFLVIRLKCRAEPAPCEKNAPETVEYGKTEISSSC